MRRFPPLDAPFLQHETQSCLHAKTDCSVLLSSRQSQQFDRKDQKHRHKSQQDGEYKRQPQRRLVTLNNLLSVRLVQLDHNLNRPPHASDHVLSQIAVHHLFQIIQERILHDQAAGGDTKDAAKAAPEKQSARDHGLLALWARGKYGHKCARELEARPDAAGDEGEYVDGGGEAAAEETEAEIAEGGETCSGHEGPFKAAGV